MLGVDQRIVGSDLTARWRGLSTFARFIAALEFRRTMAVGQQPQSFAVPLDHVFVEMPDNVQDLPFPSVCFLAGRGTYTTRGALGPPDPVDEPPTTGSPRSAVLVPFDYIETVPIEVWGSKIAERRALLAGLEAVFGAFESTTDVRLVVPDYFGLVATYTLLDGELIDDIETPRGRRRAHLYVQMTVPVARSARFMELNPYVSGAIESLGGALTVGGAPVVEPGPTTGAGVVDDVRIFEALIGAFGWPAESGRLTSRDPYLYPQPPSYPVPGPPARGVWRR